MTDRDIPPGLSALPRRTRTHPESLAAQRAVLGRDGNDAGLRGLAEQAPSEPAIALLDAWAVVADIVSFYGERLANEGYLGTATERRSVRELARALGRELRPGVSARTELVFTVEDAAGAPVTAGVPAGTPVQSIPGPDEVPQVFETGDDLAAHAGWNAVPALAWEPWWLGFRASVIWLDGRHPELRRGAMLLVVGDERLEYGQGKRTDSDAREKFDLRRVAEAVVDPEGYDGWTRVTLDDPLGFLPFRPLVARENQRVWHLTERAALFGATAPDPTLLWAGGTARLPPDSERVSTGSDVLRWKDYAPLDAGSELTIDLDGPQPSVVPGGWLILEQDGYAEAYVATRVEVGGLSKWATAGKVTKVTLDIRGALDRFDRRGTFVHCGGTELPAGRRPLGVLPPSATLRLGPAGPPLDAGRTVVVTGLDADGVRQTETATVASCIAEDDGTTTLTLTAPVVHAYRAASLVVHGNVVLATHGETVRQVLGSGDGRTPYRSFDLRRIPLTHLRATTPSGAVPALEIRVDGVRWHEVESFVDTGPADRVYRLERSEGLRDGEADLHTTVVFGDGVHGAIPPTGEENIVATYRSGIGDPGRLAVGQLQLLVRRPHGIREVTNPLPTTDSAPPETLDQARRTAPQRVRTLGRIVSVGDVADVARGYAGVGQVAAQTVWNGRTTTVVVSIRGAGGTEPSDGLRADLETAIEAIRDPRLPVRVLRGRVAEFGIAVEIALDPDHDAAAVRDGVRAALLAGFGREVRPLGEAVTAAQVLLAVRGAPGVVACTMPRLLRASAAPTDLLVAEGAGWTDRLVAAELLAVDPARIEIGELA